MAHLYTQEQSDLGNIKSMPDYDNKMRSNEFHAHAVTALINKEYGYALGFNSKYKSHYDLYLDPKFNDAMKFFINSMDPSTLYSSDSRYNDWNPTEISAAVYDILRFYSIDNNYFKNLFGKLKSWTSLEEYITAIASSMETIDYAKAKELVENSMYIKQAKADQTIRNIDIVLMSSGSFPDAPTNMQFFHHNLTGIIITGMSYIKDQYPAGTPGWDMSNDSTFYNSTATVKITDSSGKIVASYNNVKIMPGLANGYSIDIKDVLEDNKEYTITAIATIEGVPYTDTLRFNTKKQNITLNFDTTFPLDKREKFRSITDKMADAFSWATGLYPQKEIKIVYDPDAYTIGYGGSFDTITFSSTDDYSFWMFELAHQFWLKAINNANNVSMKAFNDYKTKWNLRDEEIIGQVICKIAYDKYPDMFSLLPTKDKINSALVFKEDYRSALKKFIDTTGIYTIQQQDVNTLSQYLNLPVDIYEITELYKMDRDFLYNFFNGGKLAYTSYDEYKNLFISSVKTNSPEVVKSYVDNMSYFKQIDDLVNRPRYNIDVVLFSKTDLPNALQNVQFYLDHPTHFYVLGQSYNIDRYPEGTDQQKRTGETSFYDSNVTVRIYDINNNEVYKNDSVKIQKRIENDEDLPILLPGKYTISAEITIDNQLVQDKLDFEIK